MLEKGGPAKCMVHSSWAPYWAAEVQRGALDSAVSREPPGFWAAPWAI